MTARRIIIVGVLALVLLGLAVGYIFLMRQKPLLDLGVGYGARVACGCRYMGNRSLDDCKKDFEPGMEQIRLSEDPATKTVTASVPFVTKRSVRYDPVLGCAPEKFSGEAFKVE